MTKVRRKVVEQEAFKWEGQPFKDWPKTVKDDVEGKRFMVGVIPKHDMLIWFGALGLHLANKGSLIVKNDLGEYHVVPPENYEEVIE